MTIMKKQFLRLTIFAFFLFTGSSLWGQYGIGTNNPNASAALEIVSPDKGLLIPTVTLTSTSSFSPITGTPGVSHDGMIVWNDSTSTANDLQGVGFYYWEGGAAGHWYKLSTDAGVDPGTVTNATLRWNGSSWVEDTTFLNSGTGTATFASNITVTGTLEVSDNASITANLTVTGTTEITGNTTVTADFEVGNDTSLGGTLEVTGNATITGDTVTSGALTAQDTVTLEAALVDSIGNTGTDGQVLSSTGTSTKWIDPNALTMATMTVSGNVTSTVRLLLLEPAATMTVTLPAIADVPTGYQILIRRNQGYTGSGDLITLTGNASEQINGNTTKNMDVGYQSVTLIRTPSGWISVD